MQKGRVVLAFGSPESREKLNFFKASMKLKRPEIRIKTQEDAINYAITEAMKVPELEKEIKELKEIIENLKN